MEQIALTSVFPRSIAWLVAPNDEYHLEKVARFNSATVGGVFNVLIPLNQNLQIPEEYSSFLYDFDPDFIVMAPEMTVMNITDRISDNYPYAVLPWVAASQIVSLYPDESLPHAGPTQQSDTLTANSIQGDRALVATETGKRREIDRLALIACGDVEPTRWRYRLIDGDDNAQRFDASGYREQFLKTLLMDPSREIELHARQIPFGVNTVRQVEAPSRLQLSSLIKTENTLSRTDPVIRMRECYESQRFPIQRPTFINLTASYKNREGYSKPNWQANRLPRMVLLVGDDFQLEDAALFWNLRACEVNVAWVSFDEVEQNMDAVTAWLESQRSFIFYSLGSRSGVHFSSSDSELPRLHNLVKELRSRKTKDHPHWYVVPRKDLIRYDYNRRSLSQAHTVVSSNGSSAKYAATLPTTSANGYLAVVADWDGVMLPRNQKLIRELVSSDLLTGAGHYMVSLDGGSRWETRSEAIPRFRVSRDRRLICQINSDSIVEFRTPTLLEVFRFIIRNAGFENFEPSSAAKYHENFIRLAEGFDQGAQLLMISPYRELLSTLADNHDKSKIGHILQNPSKRRALHHLHLRKLLGGNTPVNTAEYFDTVSDQLPEAGVVLLKKQLLERGFLLRCEYCSFGSWYPVDNVGQSFRCYRCNQSQIYKANPLWYYKLPEAVFQGFQDNMQVPLLALNVLRNRSSHRFEWVSDSDVYEIRGGAEIKHNLDLICSVDGRLYVGEAKSNTSIPSDQFSWYESFLARVPVDGIVFATSQRHWDKGTTDRIRALATRFRGEILILNADDLYHSRNQ